MQAGGQRLILFLTVMTGQPLPLTTMARYISVNKSTSLCLRNIKENINPQPSSSWNKRKGGGRAGCMESPLGFCCVTIFRKDFNLR